jgi:NTP pyrophosphatase (non-canonical NTP hydrolase)
MNELNREALVILQEECAEVIQAISKCFRFGLDEQHKSGVTQRANLEMEIGDMLALVDVLIDHGLIDIETLVLAKRNKIDKLKLWSKLYD